MASGTAVSCVWVAGDSRTEASVVGSADRTAFAFTVSGTVMRDLHPGAVRRTRVTVANPYPFPIKVRSIEARVMSTSQRRCRPTPANLGVGSYRGALPLTVPAHGRRTGGDFEVRMPNTVAEACKNTTFELEFTARAGRVSR
ncbi:hypothetical protein [Actinoplanes sp. CA-252034]|uniref:hypothetical protein n=1 Tax=Actinoplanes sp. CA-252034 TaxID=3239906 RepID=UPI003D96254B